MLRLLSRFQGVNNAWAHTTKDCDLYCLFRVGSYQREHPLCHLSVPYTYSGYAILFAAYALLLVGNLLEGV